jgi:urea transport system permease protein
MTLVGTARATTPTSSPEARRWGAARIGAVLAATCLALWMVPSLVDPFTLILATQALVYALLALSLQLLWGQAGQLSFGQAAFFGIGAYGYGIVATKIHDDGGWLGFDAPGGWAPLLAGILAPTVAAAVLGYFLYFGAVRGAYFSIVTLAVVVIANQVTVSWRDVTGGDTGLTRLPPLHLSIAGVTIDVAERESMYYLAAALLLFGIVVLLIVQRSAFGLVLAAIREDENRAIFLGYNTSWYLVAVLTLSGALAGLAGTAWAATTSTAAPDILGSVLSIEILTWLAVGGRAYIGGAVLGTLIVRELNNELSGVMPEKWPLLIGVFFVLVVLLLPDGIFGTLYKATDTVRRRVNGRSATEVQS